MERTNNLPSSIRKILEDKGYFDLTNEERIIRHKESMLQLEKIEHFNYEAGKRALKEIRGE